MRFWDWGVVAIYALAMLAVGRYYKLRITTTDDYLLGGRRMSPFMIGLSLFATLTSTLSYLAYPGEMIKNGPMMFAQLAAYPLIMLTVGWGLIPRIMSQDATSGYELLEKRLGLQGRLLGSAMFMALRTIWMAGILYATSSKVLVPMLGLDPSWAPMISAIMGLVTLVYSAEGGIRAVVVTDAMQSIIMFAGAIVVIGVVTAHMGGVGEWWPDGWQSQWEKPVFWFDTESRVTFMGAALNMYVWMVCTAGADQMAIQRYLSTRDAKSARRSFGVHLAAEVLISALLALTGLAVLRYFVIHPEFLAEGTSVHENADELLPRFVVTVLPPGLAGLVIAAMLSAAMSSLSSGMNSASAVITSDFLGRFRKVHWSQHENIRVARLASIGIGVAAVLLSMVVGHLASNLLELCIKVVNLLTAPLFVLFFLALFVPWSKPRGAVVATIVSVTTAVAFGLFELFGLKMLWFSPLSFVTGVLAGMIASLGPGGVQPRTSINTP